jgi:hypothetical protein
MSDIDVDRYITRGLAGMVPGAGWRWTDDRPEFHFPLEENKSYTAFFVFSVADATYKDTGPVTVDVLVNGHSLMRELCQRAGDYRLERDVPREWLAAGETRLAAEIAPAWVSPDDGSHLGVILQQAGFIPH